MEQTTVDDRLPPTASEADQEDLGDQLGLLKSCHQQIARHKLELVAAEGRLAAASLVQMLVAGLLAVLVAAAAWTLLCLAGGWYLTELGLSVPLVFLTVAVANLVAVVLLGRLIRRASSRLTFPVSRRRLL